MGISRLCVPCHLYKFPEHIDTFKKYVPDIRFVKIESTGYERLVTLDFIRKVYFKRLSKSDLSHISFRSKTLDHTQKLQILNLLKQNSLLGLDFEVLLNYSEITPITRQDTITQILNLHQILPSNDISVNYGDLFISVDNIKNTYYNLCNQLNIVPDENILDHMIKRNQKNNHELMEFSKNFEIIKQQVFST